MEVGFDGYGLAGLVGWLAAWAMAAFVLANATDRSVSRHLAILLVVEGAAVLTTGLQFFLVERADRYAMSVVHFMLDAALPPLYLLFLSHALELGAARGLRSHAGHVALWGAALAGPAVVLAFDGRFYVDDGVPGPWLAGLYVYVTAGFLSGIVAALVAYRRARTPSTRARAKAFLVAFTVFDLVWGSIYGYAAAYAAGAMPQDLNRELLLVYALATPLFVGLLAYAILKAQLFDFELRLKVGIRRGTLALVFLVTFAGVAEVAQSFLSEEFGLAVGGAVAGVLILALRPLERVADRVATAALPDADGSPAYVAFKKLEVYRAAVESALETGGAIDGRERLKLARLAEKLGIQQADAALVERDATSALAA